jgi:hypothetical protein
MRQNSDTSAVCTHACLPQLLLSRHTSGEPIPRVEYTPEEVEVWGTALSKLKELYPKHACRQVNEGLPKLGFREDEVPQLQDISDTLKAATGWQVRVWREWVGACGLLHRRQCTATACPDKSRACLAAVRDCTGAPHRWPDAPAPVPGWLCLQVLPLHAVHAPREVCVCACARVCSCRLVF